MVKTCDVWLSFGFETQKMIPKKPWSLTPEAWDVQPLESRRVSFFDVTLLQLNIEINRFLQPYTAWQTNFRKPQTSKKEKPYMRNLKWKLYPVVLSIKPSTLVLAVNSWGMHVWLPHWSLMQSELIWDTPPQRKPKRWTPEIRLGSKVLLGYFPPSRDRSDYVDLSHMVRGLNQIGVLVFELVVERLVGIWSTKLMEEWPTDPEVSSPV